MAILKNTAIDDTASLQLPVGTTAQRLGSPLTGYIRFNTTINSAEYWSGSSWITVDNSELFYFVSASFTNGGTFVAARVKNPGAQGRSGPTLAQARNGMFDNVDNVVLRENTSFFNVINGIQQLLIPQTGVYRIEARGAQGGHAVTSEGGTNRRGGRGAIIRGDVFLEKGELIKIVVGQEGIGRQTPGRSANNERGGGGGGSFVWKDSENLPLVCAGGGGAASGDPGTGVVGKDANTGTSGLTNTNNGGTGGQNGNGGTTTGTGALAGAGAGFLTDGTGASNAIQNGKAIIRATEAAVGGSCDPTSGLNFDGGFGGGGADGRLNSTSADSEGTGGGGGYSGGAGGDGGSDNGGGGGGSFVINTATNVATSNGGFSRTGSEPHPAYTGTVFNLGAVNAAHGLVSITRIG